MTLDSGAELVNRSQILTPHSLWRPFIFYVYSWQKTSRRTGTHCSGAYICVCLLAWQGAVPPSEASCRVSGLASLRLLLWTFAAVHTYRNKLNPNTLSRRAGCINFLILNIGHETT